MTDPSKAADPAPLSASPEDAVRPAPGDLSRAAARGAFWQGSSYLLSKVVTFATTVVLARLLTPDDFGIFALTLVFITYAEHLTDLGVAQALVFLPAGRRHNDAALSASLISAGLMVGIALIAAPTIAGFFGRPDVTNMFRVLSLSLFFRGTGNVPDALLRKDLLFRKRLLSEFARAAGQAVVSISLAAAGAGAWAIVLGYLAGDVLWNLVAWFLVPYKPRVGFWRIERSSAGSLIRYGAPAAAQGVLLTLVYDIDYLIIGRALGSVALGYYTLAFRIPLAVIVPVFWALSAVAFPVFSRIHADPARLRRGYERWMRVQTTFGVAAGAGMAVLAPSLVHVLFGSRWEPAIVPLQALSLYAALRSLTAGAFDLYKGIGKPVTGMWLTFARLALTVPSLLIATRYGINGVAWTQAILSLVLGTMIQGVAAHVLGMKVSRLARALAPSLIVGGATALGAGAVQLWLPGPDLGVLFAGLAAGAAAGLITLYLVLPDLIQEVKELVTKRSRATA